MASTIIVDTHQFVTEMTDAGMEPRQAEALAKQFKTNLAELATKSDLEATKNDLETSMELLKRDLTIRMGAMLFVVVSAIGALDAVIK